MPMIPIPSPVLNKNAPNFLVVGGKLTRSGFDYMKMMNVYWKSIKTKK
jgi:hypothetical protein